MKYGDVRNVQEFYKMKNLIYQFWNTMGGKRCNLSGVKTSRKNIKQYADRIGVDVGPETGYQYQPEQTTSAIICHHRQAKYFIARTPREQRNADNQ